MAKRKFVEVSIPFLSTSVEILQTENMAGKVIKLDLTKFLKGKSYEASFIIKKDKELTTEIKSLVLLQSYLIRLIRKGTSYVEDSFLCKTKEGAVRVKPFFITRTKVVRSIRKRLRDTARDYITKYAENLNTSDFFASVTTAKLQRELGKILKKIYPLALCEIRVVKRE